MELETVSLYTQIPCIAVNLLFVITNKSTTIFSLRYTVDKLTSTTFC